MGFGGLNVLIGANASGKSNVIDALRFLHLGVVDKTFAGAVRQRGGILHLAWKGQPADEVTFELTFAHEVRRIVWEVQLVRDRYEFYVKEKVYEIVSGVGRVHRLEADEGVGWWSSADRDRVELELRDAMGCALAAAADDRSFPVREIEILVRSWGVFDPNPWLLRRSSEDPSALGPYGENLAARLRSVHDAQPQAYKRILEATRSILGVPDSI